MRIAPIALFSYNNYDKLLHYVKEVTEITHAHKLGINGAILQVIVNFNFINKNIIYIYIYIYMYIYMYIHIYFYQ